MKRFIFLIKEFFGEELVSLLLPIFFVAVIAAIILILVARYL